MTDRHHQYNNNNNNEKHSVIDGNCTKDDCIAFSNIKENRTSNTSIFIDNEHNKTSQNSFHLWNSHKYKHVDIWRPRNKWEFCFIFAVIIIVILLIIFISLWGAQLIVNQCKLLISILIFL